MERRDLAKLDVIAMGLFSSLFFGLGWWRFARRQGNALLRGRS